MPGFDGTGPAGQGPMTGGGRGYCVRQISGPGTESPVFGQPGWFGSSWTGWNNPTGRQFGGRGLGMGRGMGRGRGRGRW